MTHCHVFFSHLSLQYVVYHLCKAIAVATAAAAASSSSSGPSLTSSAFKGIGVKVPKLDAAAGMPSEAEELTVKLDDLLLNLGYWSLVLRAGLAWQVGERFLCSHRI